MKRCNSIDKILQDPVEFADVINNTSTLFEMNRLEMYQRWYPVTMRAYVRRRGCDGKYICRLEVNGETSHVRVHEPEKNFRLFVEPDMCSEAGHFFMRGHTAREILRHIGVKVIAE